jgi:hypothetical protein
MVGKLVARERSCDGRVTGLIGKRSTSLTAWWDDGLG